MFFFSLLFYFLVFIFGLSVGSFLNCLIYRLPKRKNILGYSYCPNCAHQLSWLDLIPVFSFIFLAGRCRYCRAKISFQYPLVELVTGLLFLFAFLQLFSQFKVYNLEFIFSLLRNWFFISLLVFIFVYDLKYMLIEDVIVVPGIIIIFLINFLFIDRTIYNLKTIILGGFIGWLFFFIQYILTKKRGLGEGDLRVGLLIGIMFGWPKILIALFTSYLIGGIISFLLLISRRKKLYSQIPLGPFLAIGSLLTLFFGEKIIEFIEFYKI